MVILLIFGIVVFIFGIIASANKACGLGFWLGVAGSWMMMVALLAMEESSKPSAMDVYKGKTILEITYRDSVPVDSVVVFKNKEK